MKLDARALFDRLAEVTWGGVAASTAERVTPPQEMAKASAKYVGTAIHDAIAGERAGDGSCDNRDVSSESRGLALSIRLDSRKEVCRSLKSSGGRYDSP